MLYKVDCDPRSCSGWDNMALCAPPEHMPLEAGRWFSRFKDMFVHYNTCPNKQRLFCVSWDRLNASNLGSKMFGIFDTPTHYFRVIQKMPAGTVCGYEIILEGTRCKLYLDVEWETPGVADVAAQHTIDAVCAAVTIHCKKRFLTVPHASTGCEPPISDTIALAFSPCIHTTDSTDSTASTASTICNEGIEHADAGEAFQLCACIGPGCHDCPDNTKHMASGRSARKNIDKMARARQQHMDKAWKELELDFYVSTCSRSKNASVFKNSFHIVVNNVIFPNNHDGMMKDFVIGLDFPHCIDKAVYTRNRCIRTELSAKSGQKHCFRNVSALPDNDGSHDRELQLLASLITVFDVSLPTICYRKEQEAAALSTMQREGKRSAKIIRTDAGKKAKTGEPTTSSVLPLLDAYFQHIFNDGTHTKFTIREIRDTDYLPPAVKLLLERKIVCPDDMCFVYIENAKWCISQLMQAVEHRHHSNNACAVAVFVDARLDIYARCYGCESCAYAKLGTFDPKTRTLPSLRENDGFRRVVHSLYGIDCVKDSADRKRVVALFQDTQGVVEQKLYNVGSLSAFTSSIRYLWCKYVESAARGWFFISEPCHPVALHSKLKYTPL